MNGPVYSDVLGDVMVGNSDLADSCAWVPTPSPGLGAAHLPAYPTAAELPPSPPRPVWPPQPAGAGAAVSARLEAGFADIFGGRPGALR